MRRKQKDSDSMYQYLKKMNLNLGSEKRMAKNKNKGYKWIVFPLRAVDGLVSEHCFAKIIGETEYYYKINNIIAPKWKKKPGISSRELKAVKKDSITEFYQTKDKAKEKVEYLNKLIYQYNESMKQSIFEVNKLYFLLINEHLNI